MTDFLENELKKYDLIVANRGTRLYEGIVLKWRVKVTWITINKYSRDCIVDRKDKISFFTYNTLPNRVVKITRDSLPESYKGWYDDIMSVINIKRETPHNT